MRPQERTGKYPVLNWSSPQARGLVAAFEIMPDGVIDLVVPSRGHVGLQSGSPVKAFPGIGYACGGWGFSDVTTRDLAFSTTGPFTVAAWVNVPVATPSSYQDAFAKIVYNSEGNNQGWTLQTRADTNKWSFSVMNNNTITTWKLDGSTVAAGTHLIVGVQNDAGNRVIYTDGMQSGTKAVTNMALATATVDTETQIGEGTSGERIFTACARAWNRALTAQDVWELWDASTRWDLLGGNQRLGGSGPKKLPALGVG